MSDLYLYAVTTGDAHLDLGPIGVPDGRSEVFSIHEAGLAAVVSEYPGDSGRDLPQAQMLRRLLVHQQVLEKLITDHAILPVKFGTVPRSPNEVRLLLSRYQALLEASLRDVGGAVEIDLSASWDLPAILQEASHEPALAAMRRRHSGAEEANAAIEMGKRVHGTVERKREEYRRRVVNEMLPCVRDAEPNPIPTDDIVLNVAFLVDRVQVAEFDRTLDRLAEEFGDRLSFRYVGPLPPYSFATVHVVRPLASEIARAREVLGLGESVTAAELRDRYREMAARMHPDRNPGDRQAQAAFQTLVAAHDTVARYLEAQRAAHTQATPAARYDLRPESVSAALLLEITRAELESEGSNA